MKPLSLALAVLLALVGCSNVQTIAPNARALVLDREQTVRYLASFSVTLPKGRYEPIFQTDDGIYYRSPTVVINHGLGTAPQNGGLFVPKKGSGEDIGFWTEVTGNTRHYNLHDPVEYHLD